MKFSYKENKGKVVFESLLLGSFFLDYEWDEINNELNLGKGRFWATDPDMHLELEDAISEDLMGFDDIEIPEGHWVDFTDIFIDCIRIEENTKMFYIVYAVRCGSSLNDKEGDYRLIRGYGRRIEGVDYDSYGRPEYYRVRRYRVCLEKKLFIPW